MAAIDRALFPLRQNDCDLLQVEAIDQLAEAQGHLFRDRALPPGRTVQLFVQQVVHGNIACSAMRHLANDDFTDSAWCQARSRLPMELIEACQQRIVQQVRQELDATDDVGDGHRLWHGHCVYVADGSSDSMPDTPALRSEYGVPAGCLEGLGFPTSHLLLTMDLASGLLVGCVDSPLSTSDLSQTPKSHQQLSPGDVLLGDEIFSAWGHLALVLQANLHVVTPVNHRRVVNFSDDPSEAREGGRSTLRKGSSQVVRRLGEDDHLVEYAKPKQKPAWIDAEQWAQLPEQITVREIRRTIRRNGFRPITVTIVTTLLDPLAYPAEELIELRLTRWMVEINIRHLKITLGMDVLKCKTPEGARKERLIFLLVYNLIRALMLRAACRMRVNVNRLSFADTLAWVRFGEKSVLPDLKVNPLRPGRLEPRVIKRQKKEFPYMREPRRRLKSQLRDLHCDGG